MSRNSSTKIEVNVGREQAGQAHVQGQGWPAEEARQQECKPQDWDGEQHSGNQAHKDAPQDRQHPPATKKPRRCCLVCWHAT